MPAEGPAQSLLQLIAGGWLFENLIQPVQDVLASLGRRPEAGGPATVQDQLALVRQQIGGVDSMTIEQKTRLTVDTLAAMGDAIDALSAQVSAIQSQANATAGKADHALELLGNDLAPNPPHLSALRTEVATISANVDAILAAVTA